jgi:hypothetical protein
MRRNPTVSAMRISWYSVTTKHRPKKDDTNHEHSEKPQIVEPHRGCHFKLCGGHDHRSNPHEWVSMLVTRALVGRSNLEEISESVTGFARVTAFANLPQDQEDTDQSGPKNSHHQDAFPGRWR